MRSVFYFLTFNPFFKMKKIQLFFVAHLPLLAAAFGLQLFANDVTAQATQKPVRTKVSAAAKANVAVKAAGVKASDVSPAFVKDEGPSFVKSGAIKVRNGVDVNPAASFVSESGPSFVKDIRTDVRNTKAKGVNVRGAAVKAKQQ